MVAVLTVFSNAHELEEPSRIPTYFSYFVIVYWIWASQTLYDIRYQAEDGFHRLMKGLQITGLLYIGAASGNWDLSQIFPLSTTSPSSANEKVAHGEFGASRWVVSGIRPTMLMALIRDGWTELYDGRHILHRAKGPLIGAISHRYASVDSDPWFITLSLRRNVVCYLGHRQGRQTKAAFVNVVILITSIILSIVSVALPSRTSGLAITKARTIQIPLSSSRKRILTPVSDHTAIFVNRDRAGRRLADIQDGKLHLEEHRTRHGTFWRPDLDHPVSTSSLSAPSPR